MALVFQALGWCGLETCLQRFCSGHLPMAFSLGMSTPFWVCAIIGGNAVPGIGLGWLFWRRGMETSMMAHVLAHVFGAALSTFMPTVQSDAEL